MTDHDALVAAICENPDDDTPRLVLADWLDEHDKPDYAAFVRAKVELARTPAWEPFAVLCKWRRTDWYSGTPFRNTLPQVHGDIEWHPEAFRRGLGWRLNIKSLIAWEPVQQQVLSRALCAYSLSPLAKATSFPLLTPIPGLIHRTGCGYVAFVKQESNLCLGISTFPGTTAAAIVGGCSQTGSQRPKERELMPPLPQLFDKSIGKRVLLVTPYGDAHGPVRVLLGGLRGERQRSPRVQLGLISPPRRPATGGGTLRTRAGLSRLPLGVELRDEAGVRLDHLPTLQAHLRGRTPTWPTGASRDPSCVPRALLACHRGGARLPDRRPGGAMRGLPCR